MNNTKKRAVRILLAAFLLLTVAAAVVHVCTVFTDYETESHYYVNGAILPFVPPILAVLGAVCGIAVVILSPGISLSSSDFTAPKYPFVSFPAAAGFLLAGILMLTAGEKTDSAVAVVLFLAAAAQIFGAVTAVAFPSHLRDHGLASSVALAQFLCVISCILLCGVYYFDVSIEMNAPLKTDTQVALLLVMLALVGEIRGLLGRALAKLYLAVAFCAVAYGAQASVAFTAAFLAGKTLRADYAAGTVLCLFVIPTLVLRAYAILSPALAQTKRTETDGEETK